MPRPRAEIPVHTVKTLSLRVPRVDWSAITAGTKTQLRHGARFGASFRDLPRPVVLYSFQQFRRDADFKLAVLEDCYKEPLGAITPEGLAAEGVADLKAFRTYWSHRHHRGGFDPLLTVAVYCLAPWRAGDRARFGDVLMERLYGEWL